MAWTSEAEWNKVKDELNDAITKFEAQLNAPELSGIQKAGLNAKLGILKTAYKSMIALDKK